MRYGVFFERDGVLNRVRQENHQQIPPRSVAEFQINGEAVEPLRILKGIGLCLFATTNQPGLSLGWLARRELEQMHSQLRQQMPIDDVLVCPHNETDQCPCRKPRPGLFQEAAFKWHLDLDHSFVVSDKWQDAQAAHIVGATSLLLQSPWTGNVHHDYILPDLKTLVEKILLLHQMFLKSATGRIPCASQVFQSAESLPPGR